MKVVQFCENNFIHGTEEVAAKLRQNFPDIKIDAESCLSYCSDCAVGPYALVNDELIQADSADDLYEEIVKNLI